MPRAFTEEEIYMIMTVLKGELAVKQSIDLVKTFKKMKDYILENRDLIDQREVLQLSMETANNKIAISKINHDMISLEKQICVVVSSPVMPHFRALRDFFLFVYICLIVSKKMKMGSKMGADKV